MVPFILQQNFIYQGFFFAKKRGFRWVLKLSDFGLEEFRDPWPSAEDFLEGRAELDLGEVEAMLFRHVLNCFLIKY